MTIGSTYTSEYHPHPLTFVQKTEESPICRGCLIDLDDVVLECSQCKFNVHPPRPYFPDCLWMLSELETKPEPGPATDLAFYLIASDEIYWQLPLLLLFWQSSP
jgi:hypothetical protein